MRIVTRDLIRRFDLEKLGFDFMGYTFERKRELAFHHLIISRRTCRYMRLGKGFEPWNGAVLNQQTSHEYLHLIEYIDLDVFFAITSEIIDEKAQLQIRIENLRRIRDILLSFEREHDRDVNVNGDYLIKPDYVEKRISLK